MLLITAGAKGVAALINVQYHHTPLSFAVKRNHAKHANHPSLRPSL